MRRLLCGFFPVYLISRSRHLDPPQEESEIIQDYAKPAQSHNVYCDSARSSTERQRYVKCVILELKILSKCIWNANHVSANFQNYNRTWFSCCSSYRDLTQIAIGSRKIVRGLLSRDLGNLTPREKTFVDIPEIDLPLVPSAPRRWEREMILIPFPAHRSVAINGRHCCTIDAKFLVGRYVDERETIDIPVVKTMTCLTCDNKIGVNIIMTDLLRQLESSR